MLSEISDLISAAMPKLKSMGEPRNVEELMEQIAVIGQAIEKCEKILQHVAFGSEATEELNLIMLDYKKLMLEQERLRSILPSLAAATRQSSDTDIPKKSWWQIWK